MAIEVVFKKRWETQTINNKPSPISPEMGGRKPRYHSITKSLRLFK
jgi:hypothetical protein